MQNKEIISIDRKSLVMLALRECMLLEHLIILGYMIGLTGEIIVAHYNVFSFPITVEVVLYKKDFVSTRADL